MVGKQAATTDFSYKLNVFGTECDHVRQTNGFQKLLAYGGHLSLRVEFLCQGNGKEPFWFF